jgi:heme oxygenase
MSTSFLNRLLERTADWHTRIGQNMLSVNLFGANVSIEDYKKYLSALFGFVSGFEQYIYPQLLSFINDLEKRRKTNIIKDDLVTLGYNVSTLETLPENYFRSMYTDPYAALGALYVLESLTLGGELIQQHLKHALNGSAGKLKYFVAHGEDAETMWQIFLHDFSEIGENTDKQENIIDGALRTLRLLDQVMTDESVKA